MASSSSQTDLALLTVPKLELRSPLTAPALLKACAQEAGYSCKAEDWNLLIWRQVIEECGYAWQENDLTFNRPDLFEQIYTKYLEPVIDQLTQSLVSDYGPRFVGITLLAESSVLITARIIKKLKSLDPSIRFILGGPFIPFLKPNHELFDLAEFRVVNEGEQALIRILEGESNIDGVNGAPVQQLSRLDEIPWPDYSDFDLTMYPKNFLDTTNPDVLHNPENGVFFLYVTGSRGCVRNCSFCDIRSQWSRFTFRSGENLALEIQHQYSKHGVLEYYFTDSLLNGSIKSLVAMCRKLVELKDQGLLPTELRWQGQLNCYNKKRMPPEVYQLMADAGCYKVAIGIESGSESVRHHIGKEFLNEDIDYTLETLKSVGMKSAMLMMIGYPTETRYDFEQSLDLLDRWLPYQNVVVENVAIGPTAIILPGAPLAGMKQNLGITSDEAGHWVMGENTIERRIDFWLEFRKKARDLGYLVGPDRHSHYIKQEIEWVHKTKNNREQWDPEARYEI